MSTPEEKSAGPDGAPDKNGKNETKAQTRMSKVSERGKAAMSDAKQTFKEPTTGAAFAGAAVVGSALLFGLPETAVGATAGYVAFRLLRKHRASKSPSR